MTNSGIILTLAYPETIVMVADEWYSPFMRYFGIGKKNYVRAGHAALVLIDKATEVMKELASTIDEAESSSLKSYLAQIQKQITNLKSTTYLNNIVKYYVGNFEIDEDFINQMNKRKDTLPIKNGMLIDLRTGELRKRTPEDQFSFELKVSYNPDEDCKFDNVLKFFKEITQDDEDMIQYYKRFWGYCLTGETSDRSLHVFWGEGKNGKSTLINICKKILGDYYSVLDETVMTKTTTLNRGPTPELAPLAKCRIATLPESDAGEKMNSKRLKTITGDDMITYRECHCGQTTCETQAKCIMPTNHKPKININDQAVVDRIKMVPFLARFEETTENVKYIQDIYDKHLNEFFTWYVRGAVEWYSGKTLTPVECMVKEKDEFINEQDIFKDFLEETFEPVITRLQYDALEQEEKIKEQKVEMKWKIWGTTMLEHDYDIVNDYNAWDCVVMEHEFSKEEIKELSKYYPCPEKYE